MRGTWMFLLTYTKIASTADLEPRPQRSVSASAAICNFFGLELSAQIEPTGKFSSLSQTLLANRHGFTLCHSQIYANCFSFSQINYASACDPLYLQKVGSMDLYRVMKQKLFS